MRSHTYARGLVVSGLFAVILGLILVVGMTQSFASGNTETGVILLVLLGVNVLANVIYQAITTNRSEQRPASKVAAVIRQPASSNATPLDVADNKEVTEHMNTEPNAQGDQARSTKTVSEVAVLLFAMARGDSETDSQLIDNRLDRDIKPDVMEEELFPLRIYASIWGTRIGLGVVPLVDVIFDHFGEMCFLAYGEQGHKAIEERVKAYDILLNDAPSESSGIDSIGRHFCSVCAGGRVHVPQAEAISQVFAIVAAEVAEFIASTTVVEADAQK